MSVLPLIFPRVFSLNLSSFSLSMVVPPQTFFAVARVLKDLHRFVFIAADRVFLPPLTPFGRRR
jgi:hypothetical protein